MKKITLLLLTLFTMFGSKAQAQFAESFDAGIPATWTVTNVDGGLYTWANNTTYTHSGAGNVVVHWESAAHNDYLISPTIAVTNGVSNRVSFWAGINGTYYTETFQVKLSTTGTAPADFTVVLGTETATTNAAVGNHTLYNYDLSAYNGQNVHIAIVATDTDRYYLYVDDFVNDAPPSVVPTCATGLVATPNATCGNFPASLAWNAVAGVTGYNLSIGTTPGGTDVLNNQNIGLVTTYSITSPTPNTTYYWKLVPFNGVGPAVGCVEQSFVTFATPCFCTPAPTSVDGQGITNVSTGTINNTTADETGHYGDYSAQSTNVSQGLTQNVSITFATGYTYDTKIWIDWNNDYDFNDAGEEVYVGVSTATNPTTLMASFMVPAAAPLGAHRMRIGSMDYGNTGGVNVVPCYAGSYGSYEDYTVNVIVATCTPPAATASITTDCGNNQFFVTVNVTNLGSGTPTIYDGTTSWPIAGLGNVQVGPFANTSSVTLFVLHGSDGTCNLSLGAFTYTCPPANNDCSGATVLTPTGDFNSGVQSGTIFGATTTVGITPSCQASFGYEVWYTVMVPASGSLTIETQTDATNTMTDGIVAAFSGTCGSLVQVGCDDDGGPAGPNNLMPLLSLTGQTPGSTLYIGVWKYNTTAPNTTNSQFRIAAYDASLGTNSFDNANFSYYPNPVKNMLNLSYTENISNVSVFNLLGQEVMTKKVNANQSQIDMTALTAGTYVVKVSADNQVKMIKVIKE